MAVATARLPPETVLGTLKFVHRGLAHHPPDPPRSWVESLAGAWTELLLLMVAGGSGLLFVGLLLGLGLLPDAEMRPWSGIIAGPLLMAAAIATYWGAERMTKTVGGPLVAEAERMDWGRSLLAVAAHVGVAVLGSMIIGMVQEAALGAPITEQASILALIESGDPWLVGLLAIVAVLLAPLTEEVLFRGFFFRRLMSRGLVGMAWVLPGLVFALAHGNLIGLAIYVWLGLVFAHVYARTGRLVAAVLTHAGANAITLSLLLMGPQLESPKDEPALAEHAEDAAERS